MEREDTVSLQDYVVVLRRQRWVIALTTVLVVIAAVGFSLAQTPQYEAETELVVEPVRRTEDVTLEDLLAPQRTVVETERLVITSRPVAVRAGQRLDIADMRPVLRDVRVVAVSDTRVLRIVTTHPDPQAAADVSNALAEAYLDYRRDQAVDELLAARSNLEERAATLRSQIEELDAANDTDTPTDTDLAEDQDGLDVERQALVAQLGQLLNQLSEVGDVGSTVTGGGAILTPAETPSAPVSPRPGRTGALAVVLGLMLGVGLAFLRDHIDDVVRDEADFKRATGNRPILGRIPIWVPTDGGTDRLATLVEPASLASESYRELSAGVRFLLVANEPRDEPGASWRDHGHSVMVCSASAAEGKTSTACNLAVAAARVGLRTLLIDADLRRAAVAKRFGVGRTTGLSDVLLQGDAVTDHLVDVGVPNLLVLPAGTLPPNPAELLASPAMRALQREVLQEADLVIYDSPAVLAVPDSLELGRFVDVTVLVGRAGATSRRQLAASIERLEQVGTEIAGTVLNGIDHKSDGYYYSYYYTEQPKGAADTRRGGKAGAQTGGPVRDLTRREAAGERLAPRARADAAPSAPPRVAPPNAPEPRTDERPNGQPPPAVRPARPPSPSWQDADDDELFSGPHRPRRDG